MYKVLIVEDDPMARRLFEIFIEGSERYSLAYSLESASMVEFYCKTNHIDLILMDVCTAMNVSGLDAAAVIKQKFSQIKIIIVTGQPEHGFVQRARSAGVESFWYKEGDPETILAVMDRTMKGESVYPDTVPSLKIGYALSAEFTQRELEILRELLSGDTDEVIAARMNLSVWTVRKHIQAIMNKTGFTTRTQLAVAVSESGLVIRGV